MRREGPDPFLDLPSVFISHGAPTLALEPGPAGEAMVRLGVHLRQQYPGLQGIIVMSPHWMTPRLSVQSHLMAPILHDFTGFPEALYALDYPAPGSPEAADRIHAWFKRANLDAVKETRRGLDHGVWVPLRYLFPDASLPVLQVSMPYPLDPRVYFRIGEALRPLAHEGYLILGSGGLTHNLGHYQGQPHGAAPLPYMAPFMEWFHQRLEAFDLESLFDYRRLAPSAQLAHPTDDHLMPLFFAMGAGTLSRATRLHTSVSHGLLAMDIYAFGDPVGLN
jgi:4,5-DOPA dioxygenase extradiol